MLVCSYFLLLLTFPLKYYNHFKQNIWRLLFKRIEEFLQNSWVIVSVIILRIWYNIEGKIKFWNFCTIYELYLVSLYYEWYNIVENIKFECI